MTIRAALITPLLCAAVLVLAGCGGISGDQPPEEAPANDQQPAASELVGLWRVEADGLDVDTWVQLGSPFSPSDVTVWSQDCTQSGMWRARSGTLLTQLGSWSGACDGPEQPWLVNATRYAASGDGMVLIDAAGEETAQLTINGEPPSNPTIADEFREQPELTEEQRVEWDSTPAPLPEGVEPAAMDDLLGRWVPTQHYSTDPYLELAEGGTWTGSDGCNEVGGRWALTEDGSLLTVSGAQTLIGCEGHDLSSAMAQAAWLVVDGERLAFYGSEGELLDEATRT
ncbi:META domain-containing protein [Ruania halotolerans]|uniref:META domain-containing protein n=1 Tax=Ruania halotolerans TaxID=2897773 RepID=UPI001E609327|nr:META domain-containing protein [Ruania halotolerans]UFU05972.1 META domain-containing protein [Ruania halotolerans]